MKAKKLLALFVVLTMLMSLVTVFSPATVSASKEGQTIPYEELGTYDVNDPSNPDDRNSLPIPNGTGNYITDLESAITAAETKYEGLTFESVQEKGLTNNEVAFNTVKNAYKIAIDDAKALLNPQQAAEGEGRVVPLPNSAFFFSDSQNKYLIAVKRMRAILYYFNQDVVTNYSWWWTWDTGNVKSTNVYTEVEELMNKIASMEATLQARAAIYDQGFITWATQMLDDAKNVMNNFELNFEGWHGNSRFYNEQNNNDSQIDFRWRSSYRALLKMYNNNYDSANLLGWVESLMYSMAYSNGSDIVPRSEMSLIEGSTGNKADQEENDNNLMGSRDAFDGNVESAVWLHTLLDQGDAPREGHGQLIIDLGDVYDIREVDFVTVGNNGAHPKITQITASADTVFDENDVMVEAVQNEGEGRPCIRQFHNGVPVTIVAPIEAQQVRYLKVQVKRAAYSTEGKFAEIFVKKGTSYMDGSDLTVRAVDSFNGYGDETVVLSESDANTADLQNGWASGWEGDADKFTAQDGMLVASQLEGTAVVTRDLVSAVDFAADGDHYFYIAGYNDNGWGGAGQKLTVGPITLSAQAVGGNGWPSGYAVTVNGTRKDSKYYPFEAHEREYGAVMKIETRATEADKVYVNFTRPGMGGQSMWLASAYNTNNWDIVHEFSSNDYAGEISYSVERSSGSNKLYEISYGCVPIESIEANELNIAVNEQAPITYTCTPAYSLPSNLTVVSSNPAVAAVDEATGMVKGVSEGRAILTVSADGVTKKVLANVYGSAAIEQFNYPAETLLSAVGDSVEDNSIGFIGNWYTTTTPETSDFSAITHPDAISRTAPSDAFVVKAATDRHPIVHLQATKPQGEDSHHMAIWRDLATSIDYSEDGVYHVSFAANFDEWYGGQWMRVYLAPDVCLAIDSADKKMHFQYGGQTVTSTPAVEEGTASLINRDSWVFYDVTINTHSGDVEDVFTVNAYPGASAPPAGVEPALTLTLDGYEFDDVMSYIGVIGTLKASHTTDGGMRFGNIKVTKDPAKAQTNFTVADAGNGAVTYSTTVTNNTGEMMPVQMIAVKYNATGMVSKQLGTPVNVDPGKSVDFTTDPITVGSGETVKYFLWDSANPLQPYFMSIEADADGVI